jgi:hypothetical protein
VDTSVEKPPTLWTKRPTQVYIYLAKNIGNTAELSICTDGEDAVWGDAHVIDTAQVAIQGKQWLLGAKVKEAGCVVLGSCSQDVTSSVQVAMMNGSSVALNLLKNFASTGL